MNDPEAKGTPCSRYPFWLCNAVIYSFNQFSTEAYSDSGEDSLAAFEAKFSGLLASSYQVGLAGDIQKYNQLKFQHSKVITSFSANSSCGNCFTEQHKLDPTVVKNLYTTGTLLKGINIALCNEENQLAELKMITQLLCEAVYTSNENLPMVVYRGVKFSAPLVRLYQQNIGKIIYWYNFVSTSQLDSVAQRFSGDQGWIIEITLAKGRRHCVADVSNVSKFPSEKEILISCNSGFKITRVSIMDRRIYLQLVDQSNCLGQGPKKQCARHEDLAQLSKLQAQEIAISNDLANLAMQLGQAKDHMAKSINPAIKVPHQQTSLP